MKANRNIIHIKLNGRILGRLTMTAGRICLFEYDTD